MRGRAALISFAAFYRGMFCLTALLKNKTCLQHKWELALSQGCPAPTCCCEQLWGSLGAQGKQEFTALV